MAKFDNRRSLYRDLAGLDARPFRAEIVEEASREANIQQLATALAVGLVKQKALGAWGTLPLPHGFTLYGEVTRKRVTIKIAKPGTKPRTIFQADHGLDLAEKPARDPIEKLIAQMRYKQAGY